MADDLKTMLDRMNRSELVALARRAGLGNVDRERPVAELVEEILADKGGRTDNLEEWRTAIEAHIKRNRARLLSQLPGCTGQCTSYGCPDLVVASCWEIFSRDML